MTRPHCPRLIAFLCWASMGFAYATLAGPAQSDDVSGQETGITKINVTSLPSRNREIRLLRSFPTEEDEAKDIFLAQAQYFSADAKGRIYVGDVTKNEVLVFEKDGTPAMKIGRKGQGPGEFNMVGRAVSTASGLAVLDRGNSRIQYFDQSGRFTGSSKLTKTYVDIALASDGTVFAFSAPNIPGKIVSALDPEGRIKFEFGLPPQAMTGKPSISWPKISPRNELYVAYWFLPIVQVYSLTGEPIRIFELQYRPMQARLSKNEAQAATTPGGARVLGEAIIDALDVDENGFYVLYRDKRIEILEFTHEGTYVRTYWAPFAPDYYPTGLLVLKEADRKLFFLLQAAPDNRIDVFVEK